MPLKKGIEQGDGSEDTEGNMPHRKVDEGDPATDETDGNAMKPRGVDEGEVEETDDTDGNVIKAGR